MEEVTLNLSVRSSLVVTHFFRGSQVFDLNLTEQEVLEDFERAKKLLKVKYWGFHIPESEYNPNRERLGYGYEFYLERINDSNYTTGRWTGSEDQPMNIPRSSKLFTTSSGEPGFLVSSDESGLIDPSEERARINSRTFDSLYERKE